MIDRVDPEGRRRTVDQAVGYAKGAADLRTGIEERVDPQPVARLRQEVEGVEIERTDLQLAAGQYDLVAYRSRPEAVFWGN